LSLASGLAVKLRQATMEGLSKNMKHEFTSLAERIRENHSGWSGVKCDLCEKETTNAQYAYSMRNFKKPLCRGCQGLEQFEFLTTVVH